ncbi:hypothetical protein GCM10025876_30760 [Demequina litorisediminis]|uniref:Uncharacterized protein n=1 Tax=Demequina litorisediminis TaxID=1849022 RepID=A0ABQ6II85_9MICO|nr:hypothetical protein GCM10025876_30760 [Demequina litorisediminis]
MTARIPDKATVDGLEDRWNEVWENDETYRFDASVEREQVYSIDTPPPRSRARCTWATSSRTPTPTWWRASSA